MTLILKLDLDIVMVHPHTKFEVSMSNASKVIAQTDKQTGRQTKRKHYLSVYAGGKNYVLLYGPISLEEKAALIN